MILTTYDGILMIYVVQRPFTNIILGVAYLKVALLAGFGINTTYRFTLKSC